MIREYPCAHHDDRRPLLRLRPGRPGGLDRYPYAEGPGAERVGASAWEGADPELGRVGGAPQAAADADCTANSSSSWVR